MSRLTYRKAGVNIAAADDFIRSIKPLVRSTSRPGVLGGIGGFSGLFRPRLKGMKEPLLVSSTDGVGTKLMIADLQGVYDTVGLDLVAMNADDIVVAGAEPLFFLDYITCANFNTPMLHQVVKGIVRGCRQAGCALLGGETAEMPGLYGESQWDLAGFCVGVVDKDKLIDGRKCRRGDAVLGLASSGLHSNGYSLARRVFTEKELRGPLGRSLLRPTRIYARILLSALERIEIKAMSHITGGGFYDNIPRVIPDRFGVLIRKGSWPIPRIFKTIRERGGVGEREMHRTLNMGIGMAVVVSSAEAGRAVRLFDSLGQKAWVIGEVTAGRHEVVID